MVVNGELQGIQFTARQKKRALFRALFVTACHFLDLLWLIACPPDPSGGVVTTSLEVVDHTGVDRSTHWILQTTDDARKFRRSLSLPVEHIT